MISEKKRQKSEKGGIKKELFPTGTAKEKEVYEKRNLIWEQHSLISSYVSKYNNIYQ